MNGENISNEVILPSRTAKTKPGAQKRHLKVEETFPPRHGVSSQKPASGHPTFPRPSQCPQEQVARVGGTQGGGSEHTQKAGEKTTNQGSSNTRPMKVANLQLRITRSKYLSKNKSKEMVCFFPRPNPIPATRNAKKQHGNAKTLPHSGIDELNRCWVVHVARALLLPPSRS